MAATEDPKLVPLWAISVATTFILMVVSAVAVALACLLRPF